MKTQKIISAHKLIEYGFASPQKRTAIIEYALTPPTFIMDTMYPDIERATARFLQSGCKDASGLLHLDASYQAREANTDHHEQRLLNALDAISHVREMSWRIPTSVTIELAQSVPTTVEISGLLVRIKPTILLMRQHSGYRQPHFGIAKPYFGKGFPLETKQDKERGVLFATLLHWHAEDTMGFIGQPDPDLCFVGDVVRENVYFAAPRYKQRRKQLEALAQEISDRWDPIRYRLEAAGTDTRTRKTK